MRAVMETLFDVCYLVTVLTLGILMLKNARGRLQVKLFGIMAVVLGCGDAFHLVPRAVALCTDGLANHAAALGVGKLITSITMTVFYVLLYHIARERYGLRSRALFAAVYVLAAARIALCCLPQNRWLEADGSLFWDIARNIPFALLGALIIAVYAVEAKKAGEGPLRLVWLAVLLSFGFYLPVVLWAGTVPAVGALMIPKTCAYVWLVWMGWRLCREKR